MKRHRQNVQNPCAYGKRCRHKTAADRARDVQKAQEIRRHCLHHAAQTLREYRELLADGDTVEAQRWDELFRFWMREYQEMSAFVMEGN